MSEVLDYTLQDIHEGKYKVETEEENIELILHHIKKFSRGTISFPS